jgi:phage shock protein PspC (stress-responsive transcriptional regulator)
MSELSTTTAPTQRVTQRSVVAGVCVGVARRWGVDPTLVRVLTVVLALFAGVGVVLYALGWLLLPDDVHGRSLGERAVRGGDPDRASTVLLALGLVLVIGVVGAGLLRDAWFPLAVLAVVLLLAAAVLSRRPQEALGGTEAAATAVPPVAAPVAAPAAPVALAPTAELPAAAPAPLLPPAPPRPRSVLGLLTVSVAAIGTGALVLAAVAGATVPASAYVALPLAVVGAGLLAGTWWGRSRALIALGVALTLLLATVAVVERVTAREGWGESFAQRTVTPTTAVGLDGLVVEQGAGDLTYDLSAVAFPAGSTDLMLQVGAGTLTVVLPADVALDLDAEVALGELGVFGSTVTGAGLTRTWQQPAAPDAPTLQLTVEMGLGTVEVDRAQA